MSTQNAKARDPVLCRGAEGWSCLYGGKAECVFISPGGRYETCAQCAGRLHRADPYLYRAHMKLRGLPPWVIVPALTITTVSGIAGIILLNRAAAMSPANDYPAGAGDSLGVVAFCFLLLAALAATAGILWQAVLLLLSYSKWKKTLTDRELAAVHIIEFLVLLGLALLLHEDNRRHQPGLRPSFLTPDQKARLRDH